MTIIKATCPACGDVELTRDQVRLVVHPLSERSFYGFTCTKCGEEVRKPAGDEVVRLLTMGGVVVERVVVPAEALEWSGANIPVLTPDEVIDMADYLAWLDPHLVAEVFGSQLYRRAPDGGPRDWRTTGARQPTSEEVAEMIRTLYQGTEGAVVANRTCIELGASGDAATQTGTIDVTDLAPQEQVGADESVAHSGAGDTRQYIGVIPEVVVAPAAVTDAECDKAPDVLSVVNATEPSASQPEVRWQLKPDLTRWQKVAHALCPMGGGWCVHVENATD